MVTLVSATAPPDQEVVIAGAPETMVHVLYRIFRSKRQAESTHVRGDNGHSPSRFFSSAFVSNMYTDVCTLEAKLIRSRTIV